MKTPTITLTRKGPEEDGWKLFINSQPAFADWWTWDKLSKGAIHHDWALPYQYWIADGNGNYGYLKP